MRIRVSSTSLSLAVLLCCAGPTIAGPAYFLVAERPGAKWHQDSFVLPLHDEQHIVHARDLIARGLDAAGESIVFARIAPGSDGINRNLFASDQPLWSWHVTHVHGFGDLGIELIDGWPTFIENDVPGWMSNTAGEIGFWSYTVVSELGGYPAIIPPPAAAVPLPPALPAALATLGAVLAMRLRVKSS